MNKYITYFSPLERGRFYLNDILDIDFQMIERLLKNTFSYKTRGVLTLLVILLFSFNGFSQVANDAIGSRSVAMGGVSVTLSDLWSANNNQAGLGFTKELAGGIYYENRFLLKETAYKAGVFVLPTKSGAIGLNVASFGYSAYSETKAGLSYGQRFGDKFSIGMQLNYLNTRLTQEYGSNNAITGAVGLIAKLNKELTMGVHVYNPTKSNLADYDNERIPTVMKIGLDYRFSEKVIFALETEKANNHDALVRFGVEYRVLEMLYLRGGISTKPTLASFGFGLKLKDFKIALSSSFHQTLGITPSISIIYVRAKRSKKSTTPSI